MEYYSTWEICKATINKKAKFRFTHHAFCSSCAGLVHFSAWSWSMKYLKSVRTIMLSGIHSPFGINWAITTKKQRRAQKGTHTCSLEKNAVPLLSTISVVAMFLFPADVPLCRLRCLKLTWWSHKTTFLIKCIPQELRIRGVLYVISMLVEYFWLVLILRIKLKHYDDQNLFVISRFRMNMLTKCLAVWHVGSQFPPPCNYSHQMNHVTQKCRSFKEEPWTLQRFAVHWVTRMPSWLQRLFGL